MPFVKIHMSSNAPIDTVHLLIQDVRKALTEILQIKETIGQVMVYQTPVQYRGTHQSRDINFVFTEIFMYPGRPKDIKKKLMDEIKT